MLKIDFSFRLQRYNLFVYIRISATIKIPPEYHSRSSSESYPQKHLHTKEKGTDNHQIISVFCCSRGAMSPVPSGAGGSRTPVQTRRKYAFYKFSLRLIVGGGMVRDGPKRRLSSKVSPQPRSAASAISPFMILRSGR